jgi:ABC-2 type transport system ATP-binding protein
LYLDLYVREYFITLIYQVAKSVLTGLTTESHKKIGQLSKGYRQRGALMRYPDVLILDEPTTGLDPNQLIEIRDVIKMQVRTKLFSLYAHYAGSRSNMRSCHHHQ